MFLQKNRPIQAVYKLVLAYCRSLFFVLFAGLVGNTTGGLARGLTGCLALAAAALAHAGFQVTGFKGFNLHTVHLNLNVLAFYRVPKPMSRICHHPARVIYFDLLY